MLQEDLLPEQCHYRDEGCDLAPACLECPFPRCLLEEPDGKRRWLKGRRDQKMYSLFYEGGRAVREIAVEYRVSERTVQRALRAARGEALRRLSRGC